MAGAAVVTELDLTEAVEAAARGLLGRESWERHPERAKADRLDVANLNVHIAAPHIIAAFVASLAADETLELKAARALAGWDGYDFDALPALSGSETPTQGVYTDQVRAVLRAVADYVKETT
jgi:hypothetical protein